MYGSTTTASLVFIPHQCLFNEQIQWQPCPVMVAVANMQGTSDITCPWGLAFLVGTSMHSLGNDYAHRQQYGSMYLTDCKCNMKFLVLYVLVELSEMSTTSRNHNYNLLVLQVSDIFLWACIWWWIFPRVLDISLRWHIVTKACSMNAIELSKSRLPVLCLASLEFLFFGVHISL